ncbi:MAG: bifunctional 5,10-methylenetetrahydrofolate dehydrogenase/5,10-methenyltetrahydrofolate cyclohydrolase [Planctomycetes bacterium]|nr:bifunctional 5,10-methylenetetrahydrofolate dehydrogenase/5,10-methenyltetrahydrofolate cyclohydrolase [Planctomycetota bacterium]
MPQIIDGKALAKAIRQDVKTRVGARRQAPQLVAVQIGHDDASAAYTRSQARTAEKLGIHYRLDTLAEDATQGGVAAHLDELAKDPATTGIMLQLPLPGHLDATLLRRLIPVEKDVEAITEAAAGRLVYNAHLTAPCTAVAALECLRQATGDQISGLDVAVLGRSTIVGRPLALLLLHANATPTICHTRTKNLAQVTARADVLIAAVGRPGLVTPDMVKDGAIVIDVGTNWVDDAAGGHLEGDVAYDLVAPKTAAITPVPGGVGPVTTAILMRNLLDLG